jgi:enoyl-CoA hydratase/carnithine racemase
MDGFDTIVYEKKGPIAVITLNRPEFLNAYNIRMRDELYQVLCAIKDDTEVKVIVLRGAGEKAFCAGADLTEFLTAPSQIIARCVRWERDIWGAFLSIPQPLIASLHGYVLGSGLEMALCCDLKIASDDTKFGLPEMRLGLIPAAGATQTMPRTIGVAKTLDMLLNGSWLTAQEAFDARLINHVVSRDKLTKTVESLARKIASFDTTSCKAAKQAIIRGRDLPLSSGLEIEMRLAKMVQKSIITSID